MTSEDAEGDDPHGLAVLVVEAAYWPVDSLWRRGLAIRTQVLQFQPELVFLDEVKLPPGALSRLTVRVAVLGDSAPWGAQILREAHPGIAAAPMSPNVTLLAQVWDRRWHPPVDDLGPFGIPAGAFAVGWTATKAEHLLRLVETGHWLPIDLPIHFLVVVPDSERNQLKRDVLATMLPQRYHFHEGLELAPSLLASCNLAVLSYDEPIQRASTLNALANGVPLISLLSGTLAPQVTQADGAEQLAAKILELHEDRGRYAELADASRQSFGEHEEAAARLARTLRDDAELGLSE